MAEKIFPFLVNLEDLGKIAPFAPIRLINFPFFSSNRQTPKIERNEIPKGVYPTASRYYR